ncbi:MAG: hypothetical protein EPN82_01860 [Bacteroidetes bacterium]|nr:MAG: hypothetical protein EPN82_01860 [Bacteroidota bacterium]
MLLVFSQELLSQNLVVDTTEIKKKDTINFKLKFYPGDTLVYIVKSGDSIIIDYGKPLIKSRTEKIKIVCDSVNKDGHFYLTQSLIEFSSTESQGDEKNIENKLSPWLNRNSVIVTDSVGNRISVFVNDSINAALCPGGAFQPYLIFPFNANKKAVNESWIASSLDELVENGVPFPLLRQSSLFRAKGIVDTLGDKCSRFEFIKTGQGSIPVVTEKEQFKVTNVINGFGVMDISITRNLPVHFYSSVEQKLTLHFPNDVTKPGLHYINSYFTLESLKHKKINNNIKKIKKVR